MRDHVRIATIITVAGVLVLACAGMGAVALSKSKSGFHYTPVYSTQDDVDKIGSDDLPMNHPPRFLLSNYGLG